MLKPGVYIFVMNRSWHIVGYVKESQSDALFVRLGKSAAIREWGTTKGLGQLASEGVRPSTRLMPEPEGVLIKLTSCDRIIPCVSSKWSDWHDRV